MTGFFDDALPGRAEAPWKVFAMEGNGRRGREVGKEGPLAVIRGGRGRAFDARGDETCGRTEAGLREEGAADIVMTVILERMLRNGRGENDGQAQTRLGAQPEDWGRKSRRSARAMRGTSERGGDI